MTRPALLSLAAVVLAAGLATPALAQGRQAHLDHARQLMREVPLIDGHNDLPWAIRTVGAFSFDSIDIAVRRPELHTDIPRLREGLVGAQFWSTYTPSAFAETGAARGGMEENDIVHRMIARYPETFELALTADDIERIFRAGKIGSLLGLEGGHMIENSLGVLRAFFRDGVRYMTLTHFENVDWADASTDEAEHGGLTPFGEAVVGEMNRLGMLVDVSHVSDSSVWDVLRVTEAPVFFSHSSSRHFTPHPRNVPDDIVRAVAANGGVILVNFVASFIDERAYEYEGRRDALLGRLEAAGLAGPAVRDSIAEWETAHPFPVPDLNVVADHMEHLRDVGGVDHVGIGSDFDGISHPPVGLEDVSTFPNLIAELLRRGWSDDDVRKVLGLNVLRVMRETEAVAARLRRERGPDVRTIEELDGHRGG